MKSTIPGYVNFNGEEIFKSLDNGKELWDIFNRNEKEKNTLWHVCFGGMCYIKHDTLMKMHSTCNFHKLIDKIKNK
jgi:hypothetical protein